MPPSDQDGGDPKADRHSLLTGEQIRYILERCDVSHRKFVRDSGLARATITRMLRGDLDGDVPRSIDPLLLLYCESEHARTTTNERLISAEWILEFIPPAQ